MAAAWLDPALESRASLARKGAVQGWEGREGGTRPQSWLGCWVRCPWLRGPPTGHGSPPEQNIFSLRCKDQSSSGFSSPASEVGIPRLVRGRVYMRSPAYRVLALPCCGGLPFLRLRNMTSLFLFLVIVKDTRQQNMYNELIKPESAWNGETYLGS